MKNNKKKGFTLIETLVSISILMVSIVAPLSLASKGIEASNLAKQQIIAYYLAQDAYEFIKNAIDTNKLKGYLVSEELINGLEDCDNETCIIDTLDGSVVKSLIVPKIKYNTINGSYQYGGGDDSIYTRDIEIIEKIYDANSNIKEIIVKVTVIWNVPFSGEQKYELKGHITSW